MVNKVIHNHICFNTSMTFKASTTASLVTINCHFIHVTDFIDSITTIRTCVCSSFFFILAKSVTRNFFRGVFCRPFRLFSFFSFHLLLPRLEVELSNPNKGFGEHY